jgi:hypothetical protein
MHLHPSLTRELSITRHHDAEHAAARARRASAALPTRPEPRDDRRPPAPIGGCAEACA